MVKDFFKIFTISAISLFLLSYGAANAATVLFPYGGGTGTSTAPVYGQILVGTAAGVYQLQATSTLGISGGGSSSAYPFPLTGNATSTLTQFNGGLTAYASSTIGNGGVNGLTINGNATTTGQIILTNDGSVSAPSIFWSDMPNTGIYKSTSNIIDTAITGSDIQRISSNGEFMLGTAYQVSSNTTFQWSSGTAGTAGADTGLSRLGAAKVGLGNGTNGDVSGTLIAANIGVATSSPFEPLSVVGNQYFSGNATTTGSGVFGGTLMVNGNTAFAGTAVSPNYNLTIGNQVADPATFFVAINGQKTVSLSATNAQQVTGVTGTIGLSASTFNDTGNLSGGVFQADNSNTGTASTLTGVDGLIYNVGAGTITNAYAVQANIQNLNTAGKITNGYYYYAGRGFNSSTISNLYGLYIDTLPAATSTWGVYENSTAQNYFNGNVGTGTTTPEAQLSVGYAYGSINNFAFSVSSSTSSTGSTGTNLFTITPAGGVAVLSSIATSTFAGDVFIGSKNENPNPYLIIATSSIPLYSRVQGDLIDSEYDWNGQSSINIANANRGSCASATFFADGNNPTLGGYYGTFSFLNDGWTGVGCGIGAGTAQKPEAVVLANPTGEMDFVIASTTNTGAADFNWFSNTNTQLMKLTNAGNLGIGTTTPGSLLSVQGIANFTTATSTFQSTGGINLTAGCYAINGTCLSTGGSTFSYLYPVLGIGTTSSEMILASTTIGNGTATGGLTISGNATTTGQLIASAGSVTAPSVQVGGGVGSPGLYAIGTTALGLTNGVSGLSWNGTAFFPNTTNVRDLGVATTNIWNNLYVQTASTTNMTISGLGTPAGAFLAVNGSGQVIATTSPASYSPVGTTGQFPYFSASNTLTATSSLFLATTGNLGIGTTSPYTNLSILDTNFAINPLSIYTDGLTASSTTYTSNGTYNAPAGTESVVVQVVGGGGGGASAGSNNSSGGGGGSTGFGPNCIAPGGGGGGNVSGGTGGSISGGGTGGSDSGSTPTTGFGGGGGALVTCSFSRTQATGATITIGQAGTGANNGTAGNGGTGVFAGASGQFQAPAGGGGGTTGAGGQPTGGAGGSLQGSTTAGGTGVNPTGGASGNGTAGGTTGANGSQGSGGGGNTSNLQAGNGGNGQVIVTSYIDTNTTPIPLFTINTNGTLGIALGTTTSQAFLTEDTPIGLLPRATYEFINGIDYLVDLIDSAGHHFTGGPKPTCGTGCVSVSGDDNTMEVFTSTSVSTVIVNFATAWSKHPICIPTDESGVNTGVEASTTVNTLTLVFPTALTSKNVGVICQPSVNFTY